MQKISKEGLDFIKKWELYVGYVYDDKVPMRRINGKRQYPEYRGGPVVGTLTIGYGHTNAAGYPRITPGMKMSEEEASDVLDADLDPCEAAVRKQVKVPLTQRQFDTLVSFTYNCGPGNLKKLIVDLNKGNFDTFPRKLMQYVSSKGERMQGLVNRRSGELHMWNTPDDPGSADDMPVPKGEQDAPPKSILMSKTGNASILAGAGGIITSISTLGDQAKILKTARDNLAEIGIVDLFMAASHLWSFWAGLSVIGCAAFIYWDRHRKLVQEHI